MSARMEAAMMRWIIVVISICACICSPAAGKMRQTGIHRAAREGDISRIKSILAADSSMLNARDEYGDTPLTTSAAYAQWDVFRYLLEAGADVNVITRSESTPLHCVCYYDCPDMIELLFQRGGGAGMRVGDVYGEYTPMLRAVQRGCRNVVALLFDKGASPEEKTKEGWNALHLAALCGHRHLYDLLIAEGVSTTARDNDGKEPMDYDRPRPKEVDSNDRGYRQYTGWYTWRGAPDGPGVEIFLRSGELMLDDNCLNALFPIGVDTFDCRQDPLKVAFLRNEEGGVDRVELHFLRRSVMLDKVE